MFRQTDAQMYMVVGYSPTHATEPGASLHLKMSEDRGQTWKQVATLYSVQPDDATARRVQGVCAHLRGDQMTVVLSTSRAAGVDYSQTVMTAPHPFTEWTQSTIPLPAGFSPSMIVQGELQEYPTVAGGNDATGLICYAYSGAEINAIYTVDGSVWDMMRVTVTSATALGSNLEVSIARIGGETQWFGVIRPHSPATAEVQAQLATFTSNNMTTFSVVWPSGIPNRPETLGAGDGNVGTWSAAVYHKGKAGVLVFNREGWGFGRLDQLVTLYERPGSQLWDAGGSFVGVAPIDVAVSGERGLGQPFFARDEVDNLICAFRTSETVYATASPYSGAQNSVGIIYEGRRFSTVSPGLVANPEAGRNLFHNGDFHSWRLGTSWPAITSATVGVGPDRWRTNPSGAQFTVSRVELPSTAREAMPHRPQYGMRIVSNDVVELDNSGFHQIFYGDELARSLSRSRFVMTVWGYGPMPSPNITVTTSFGGYSGGGAKNTATIHRLVSQPSGVWCAEFVVDTALALGYVLDGVNQQVSFSLNRGAETSGAWNAIICGMFLHRGNLAAPCLPSHREQEAAIINRYSQVIGASGITPICTVNRPASTEVSHGVLIFPEMARVPVVGFSSPVGDFTILSNSGETVITGISADRVKRNRARIIATHASVAHGGGVLSVANDGFITLDAERAI